MTTWPLSLTFTLTTRTPECECAMSRFFSFVSTVSHRPRTLDVAQVVSLVFVIHLIHMRSWSERLSSTLFSPYTSRTSCLAPSTSSRTWCSKTNCCALHTTREWTCLTSSTSPQIMNPTPTTSRRLLSSPTQSSWTRRRSSPTKGFPWTPSTMTLHSRVCFVKLTEYIAILSVSLSSSSVSDRTVRPVGDRTVRPTEQSSQETQIRTLLDRKRANSCRVPSKN